MLLYSFLESAVPFLVAVSILVFVWGFLMYSLNKSDGDKRKDGINIMISGALVVFFAVAFWGIVLWITSIV